MRGTFRIILLLGVQCAWPQGDSNWVALFNGRDLSNWYAYLAPPGGPEKRYENPADDPARNYRVENGEIVHTVSPDVNQTVGYLGTDVEYSRYHFRVEYKLGARCAKGVTYCKNSGLMYHMAKDGIFGTGIECNMYWDWPTAIAGLGGVKFDRSRAGFQNFEAEANKMNQYTTDGAWNVMEIKVWGDSAAEHYVNGRLGGWVVGLKQSNGTPLAKGRVALQIEGNDVSFRNPRIRDLDKPVRLAPGRAPAGEFFALRGSRLDWKGGEAGRVDVFTLDGKRLFSRATNHPTNQPASIDFRTLLPSGVYLLEIRSRASGRTGPAARRKLAL